MTTVEIARVATAAPAAFAGRVSLITDDETGLAARLADEWTRSGQQVVLFRHGPDMPVATESVFSLDLTSAEAVQSAVEKIRSKYGAIGALVHLLPLRARQQAIPGKLSEWRDQVRQDVRSLYLLTRAVDADLRQVGKSKGALLAVVTGRGGEFGLQPLVSTTPADFAAADFLKTAALEFPEVLCKAIDVDPGDPLPILSRKLQEELDLGDDTLQIGLPGDRRLTVAPRLAELQSSVSPKIEQDWVCLLTGGARGITAQIARKLAAKCRPTLILAGASAIDNAPEPPGIQGITDPPKLKGALLAHLRASNPAVKPADVEAAYQQILRRREIQGTLNALRAMGSRVEYHAVDVRDEAAFGGLIGNIYQAHGRLDLVIHGAGIIEDKLIRDKTPESFDRVVHTKSDSSWLLTRYLRKDTLKCLIFMSSITAAFGNRGQADYAAANGIMNGLAVLLAAQWPCHVVAMNWGPWDQGGMVSEEVRQQFLTLGVQLIAPEAGAEAVLLEIESAEKGHPLAVFGDGPWSKTLVSGVRPASARIAGKAAGKVAG